MNPNEIINMAMNNSQMMQNPIFRNAIDMYRRGDVNGIKTLAENLCRERGMDPQDVLKQFKR